MIKVEYVLDGTKGELELVGLTSFESKEDILEVWGKSSVLEDVLVEDVMGHLKPEVDATADMYACERGGERNLVTAKSQAEKFGFSHFSVELDGNNLVIC
jgi:hypothetical protein